MAPSPSLPDTGPFPVELLERGRPTGERWATDPVPFPDELFSSWLARMAHANAMGPDSFLTHLRLKSRIVVADPDREQAPRLIAYLERQTGHRGRIGPLQRFAHPIGRPWAGTVVAPRFCPLCWREDASPYLPWFWRVDLAAVCVRHNRFLHDRCPRCLAELVPLHGSARRPLWRCHGCGTDLRTVPAAKASRTVVRGQQLLQDLAALAEDIDRPELIEHALTAFRALGGKPNDAAWTLRQRLHAVGASLAAAHEVLVAPATGSTRTLLVRLLAGGSLDALDTAVLLPARCWPSIEEAMRPPRQRRRPVGADRSALVGAYAQVWSRITPARALAIGLTSDVRSAPVTEVRSATVADVKAAAQLLDRRSAAGSEIKSWMGVVNGWLTSPRTHLTIGTIDTRVVQLALFVDAILTVLVVEAALEDQLPTFLRALRQAVHRRCLLAGAQAMDAGISPNRVVLFEAAGWRRHGEAPYRFACDFLMAPRHGPPVHMRHGLLDEAQLLSGRAAGS
ncbi:TniQ family protein [Azospirillum sp. TSO35-2]|jgi:hypothetical protein|uniref:TniQ family protein n=1 Tax=Azospirillum sp. TSO35-2 TaxID=716796 RepID=UPI000D61BA2F|nr:TniQ family protein [Azospirillum sp. TSO35-2]PWC40936.1 hypothetical protein TSO352_00325 [Azospirillum sp. TSO35-2]